MSGKRKTIVAEVSKNWSHVESGGKPKPIAMLFEEVIEVNRDHGYRLRDWSMTSIQVSRMVGSVSQGHVCETIVAVFDLDEYHEMNARVKDIERARLQTVVSAFRGKQS